MSKILKYPVNLMQKIVKSDKKGEKVPHKKYEMISAHDEQISNLWQFLQPINFLQDDQSGNYKNWYYIPYASHINMELHKKKNCEKHCHYVLFSSNGQPL